MSLNAKLLMSGNPQKRGYLQSSRKDSSLSSKSHSQKHPPPNSSNTRATTHPSPSKQNFLTRNLGRKANKRDKSEENTEAKDLNMITETTETTETTGNIGSTIGTDQGEMIERKETIVVEKEEEAGTEMTDHTP